MCVQFTIESVLNNLKVVQWNTTHAGVENVELLIKLFYGTFPEDRSSNHVAEHFHCLEEVDMLPKKRSLQQLWW